tara:strand:+ start:315 stop:551 length:237 start_codon:yes stop_codon:yes gene_type:complete
MTELTEEHFEVHSSNRDKMYQKQKVKHLEDRITTLEKSIGRLNKLTAEIWKHLEGNNDDQGNTAIITEERIRENKNDR